MQNYIKSLLFIILVINTGITYPVISGITILKNKSNGKKVTLYYDLHMPNRHVAKEQAEAIISSYKNIKNGAILLEKRQKDIYTGLPQNEEEVISNSSSNKIEYQLIDKNPQNYSGSVQGSPNEQVLYQLFELLLDTNLVCLRCDLRNVPTLFYLADKINKSNELTADDIINLKTCIDELSSFYQSLKFKINQILIAFYSNNLVANKPANNTPESIEHLAIYKNKISELLNKLNNFRENISNIEIILYTSKDKERVFRILDFLQKYIRNFNIFNSLVKDLECGLKEGFVNSTAKTLANYLKIDYIKNAITDIKSSIYNILGQADLAPFTDSKLNLEPELEINNYGLSSLDINFVYQIISSKLYENIAILAGIDHILCIEDILGQLGYIIEYQSADLKNNLDITERIKLNIESDLQELSKKASSFSKEELDEISQNTMNEFSKSIQLTTSQEIQDSINY